MGWSAAGAALLAVAVMLGAFGAHALRGKLDDYSMGIWERAVFYHFVHALGLLMAGLFARTRMITDASLLRVGVLLAIGIGLFSGSLYVLALTRVRALGAVTPFGGLAFIGAWLVLAWSLLRGGAGEV